MCLVGLHLWYMEYPSSQSATRGGWGGGGGSSGGGGVSGANRTLYGTGVAISTSMSLTAKLVPVAVEMSLVNAGAATTSTRLSAAASLPAKTCISKMPHPRSRDVTSSGGTCSSVATAVSRLVLCARRRLNTAAGASVKTTAAWLSGGGGSEGGCEGGSDGGVGGGKAGGGDCGGSKGGVAGGSGGMLGGG